MTARLSIDNVWSAVEGERQREQEAKARAERDAQRIAAALAVQGAAA